MNTAQNIRRDLKAAGYRVGGKNQQVSVRTGRGGSSVNVEIKAKGVKLDAVKEIAEKHRSVRYDEHTQCILRGGNTFVFVEIGRKLMEPSLSAARAWLEALPADRKSHAIPGTKLSAVCFSDSKLREFSIWRDDEHLQSGDLWEIGYAIARRLVEAGAEFEGAAEEKPPEIPTMHGVPVKQSRGRWLLAHPASHDYPGSVVTYSNDTQARKRAANLQAEGVPCRVVGCGWSARVEILEGEKPDASSYLPADVIENPVPSREEFAEALGVIKRAAEEGIVDDSEVCACGNVEEGGLVDGLCAACFAEANPQEVAAAVAQIASVEAGGPVEVLTGSLREVLSQADWITFAVGEDR